MLGLQDEMPLMPSPIDFFEQEGKSHRTLIAIVPERTIVDSVIQATQSVVGDLNQPNIGILVILPLLEAYGMTSMQEKGNEPKN